MDLIANIQLAISLSIRLFSRKPILYIFILAFVVRFCFGFFNASNFHTDFTIIAQNLLQGAGYTLNRINPTAWRTPGYPLILAGFLALFGKSNLLFTAFKASIGAINAVLCANSGIKIFNRKIGLIAGFLYAIIPYLAKQEVSPEGDGVFITLGLLVIFYLLIINKPGQYFIWAALSGLILAFSYLVRPSIGLIIIFIAFCVLIDNRSNKKLFLRIACAAILLTCFLTGITPWITRNKQEFGKYFFGQSNLWLNLYLGNNRQTFEIYPYLSLDNLISMQFAYDLPQINRLTEFDREALFREKTLREIKLLGIRNICTGAMRKLLYLYQIRMVPYSNRENGNENIISMTLDKPRSFTENMAFSIPYTALLMFAVLGCWLERKRTKLLFFAAGILVSFSLPYLLTISYSRYTTQVYFIFILFAARGIEYFLKSKD